MCVTVQQWDGTMSDLAECSKIKFSLLCLMCYNIMYKVHLN
jgi:hypothetical protein